MQISERNVPFMVIHFQLWLHPKPGLPTPSPKRLNIRKIILPETAHIVCNKCSSILQLVTGFVRDSAETILPT